VNHPIILQGFKLESAMSETKKKIEKVKSFDKRASLLFHAEPSPSGADLEECLNLVIEKAKYGEHFAQIAYMCDVKKFAIRQILLECQERAVDHPSQAGKILRGLFLNGFTDDGVRFWHELTDRYRDEPSYYAQVLSFGHWFPEVQEDTLKRISDFKKTPDWAEYGDLTQAQEAPVYINF
jgi:hypothetical protein